MYVHMWLTMVVFVKFDLVCIKMYYIITMLIVNACFIEY